LQCSALLQYKYGFTVTSLLTTIPCVSVKIKGIDRDFIAKANPGVIDKARNAA